MTVWIVCWHDGYDEAVEIRGVYDNQEAAERLVAAIEDQIPATSPAYATAVSYLVVSK